MDRLPVIDELDHLRSTSALIDRSHSLGLHTGVQLYASIGGEPVVDVAHGTDADGVDLQTDTLLPWRCATKPVTAVALARHVELGGFDLDQPVAEVLPDLVADDRFTSRDLLHHRVAFRHDPPAESILPRPWSEVSEAIGRARPADTWSPETEGSYSLWTGWTILGEILRRLGELPLAETYRAEVFEPLGMTDCWIGMPVDRFGDYGTRIGRVGDDRPGRDRWERLRQGAETCTHPSPADGGRGPARQLARLYETMLAGGGGLLEPATVDQLTTARPVRSSTPRRTMFARDQRWGLGFLCDADALGPDCSPRAFGARGLEHTITVADPAHDLVIVVLFATLTDEMKSARRNRALVRALYRDLLSGRGHLSR